MRFTRPGAEAMQIGMVPNLLLNRSMDRSIISWREQSTDWSGVLSVGTAGNVKKGLRVDSSELT